MIQNENGNGKTSKTYVLDTSVLLQSPMSILAFEDNTVVIPFSVLEKLGEMKSRPGELGSHAKECNRILDGLCRGAGNDISRGVRTPAGGIVRVGSPTVGCGAPLVSDDPIGVCKTITESILVTQDENQRVKANCAGVRAESYKHDQVDISKDGGYTGRATMLVMPEHLEEFAEKGILSFEQVKKANPSEKLCAYTDDGISEVKLEENMFLILRSTCNPNQTMLGRVSGKNIVKLRYIANEPVFGARPRNVGQRFALEALLAPAEEAPLVILKGPAGTAKTFLAMAAGLEKTYEKNPEYSRILVSRPNTKFDDDIGYLKGGEQEKIGPLIRPIMDNLENLMPGKAPVAKDGQRLANPAEELLNNGVIVAQAMAYMRGRSICNNYIVIDEAQNASINQILGLITRVGEGSKIVILGDPNQIDHPYLDRLNNGLSYASERMKGSPLCWQVTFSENECTRSKLAAEAIQRLSPTT